MKHINEFETYTIDTICDNCILEFDNSLDEGIALSAGSIFHHAASVIDDLLSKPIHIKFKNPKQLVDAAKRVKATQIHILDGAIKKASSVAHGIADSTIEAKKKVLGKLKNQYHKLNDASIGAQVKLLSKSKVGRDFLSGGKTYNKVNAEVDDFVTQPGVFGDLFTAAMQYV